jgi:hypothetical protein
VTLKIQNTEKHHLEKICVREKEHGKTGKGFRGAAVWLSFHTGYQSGLIPHIRSPHDLLFPKLTRMIFFPASPSRRHRPHPPATRFEQTIMEDQVCCDFEKSIYLKAPS